MQEVVTEDFLAYGMVQFKTADGPCTNSFPKKFSCLINLAVGSISQQV